MAEDIRLSVGADTTQMESQIANAAKKAAVVIRPTIDSKGLEKISAPLGRITGQADEFSKSMEAANARVLAFGASVGVLNAVAKSFQNIVTASTQVEASLKEIQVATGETSGNLERLGKGIFEVARSTGLSFKQASEATLEFARQGGTLEDSLMKAKAALVLTRTTGLDAAEAVKGLTAAVLSFNQVGLDYETVVNKLAAVDTKFAVSSRDLIEGISRSASVAQEAGVSFDELTALITTLQEKTARGGAVIGNALKTIFQRVQTTENLDYIRNLGIAVNDVSGDILPATTIIKKLADEFQNLDSATRKGLLIKIGGGFQIDKLAALLNDISNANGTFNRSLEQSTNAGNEGFKKLDELNKTVQASFDRLTTSGTQFAATIGKVAFSDDFRSILNKTSSFLESLNESISGGEEGGATIGKAIVKGIGSVITGPGALLIAGLGIKLFGDLAKFGVDSLKNQLGVTNVKKEQQDIEKSILGLLLQNTAVQTKIVSLEGNKTAQAEYLLGLYSKQAATLEKMSKLSKEVGPSVYEGGIRLTTEGTKNVKAKTAAGGYMSKEVAKKMEMQEAPAGASIKEISNFNFGPTEGRGTMIVNSMESVYKTPMGDFVVPSYSKTRTGKPTLFSASGYVPNFADVQKSLDIDANAYSFAGLTIGGTGLKTVRGKQLSPQLLSEVKDPALIEALSKYSKLNFKNVSVGNIYRRRDQNLDSLEASEEDIKNHFLKKANEALSPQIGTFIKDELSSLGIKPTATMQLMMNRGKKFDFVNDSMAGTFFETMLKMANMSAEDENFGQFFNDSNSRFDIYGLKPDIAEQYGLPKKFWEYVEIKSSEKALNDELGTKFIQQLSQPGGEALKAKLLNQSASIPKQNAKTASKGYIPNFSEGGFAYEKTAKALRLKDKEDKVDSNKKAVDIFKGEIKPIRQNKTIKEYTKQAQETVSSIVKKLGKTTGKEIDDTKLNTTLKEFEKKGIDPVKIKSVRTAVENLNPTDRRKNGGYLALINQVKGILGEIDASKKSETPLTKGNAFLDLISGDEVKTTKSQKGSEIFLKAVKDHLTKMPETLYNGSEDIVPLGTRNVYLPKDTPFTAAQGYIPNFAIKELKNAPVMTIGDRVKGATIEQLKNRLGGNESYTTDLAGTKVNENLDINKIKNDMAASILGPNYHLLGNDGSLDKAYYAKLISAFTTYKTGKTNKTAFGQMPEIKSDENRAVTGEVSGFARELKYEKLGQIFDIIAKNRNMQDVWTQIFQTKAGAGVRSINSPDEQSKISKLVTQFRPVVIDELTKRLKTKVSAIMTTIGRDDAEFLALGKSVNIDEYGNLLLPDKLKVDKLQQEKRFVMPLQTPENLKRVGKSKLDRIILKDPKKQTNENKSFGTFNSTSLKASNFLDIISQSEYPYGSYQTTKEDKYTGRSIVRNVAGWKGENGIEAKLNSLNQENPFLAKKIKSIFAYDKNKKKMVITNQAEAEKLKNVLQIVKDFNISDWDNIDFEKSLQTYAVAKTASEGYIPNFSREAILDAIGREQSESGLPLSAIKVVQDARVRGPQNPDGYAVINNRDEPDGKVPNFAAPSSGLDPAVLKAIEESLNGLKNLKDSSLNLDDAFKRIADNLGVSGEAVVQVFDKMTSSGSDVTSTNQTAAANSAQNTKQGNKEAQDRKTTNEKQNKTVQDSLYTLIKWQSAVSLASGVISSFGENGKVAAEVLTELSSIGLLFTQGKEVLEGFTKDRSSGAGKALRLGGAGREGAASLSSSLSIAGNFGRVANTAGVGVGGAIGGITAGLAGPAAAIYAAYKATDVLNTLYKKYGETADRTADALGRLNDIQKTYTLNLTEEQKAKSESFVRKVGTFEAATAFDRAFNFQNLNPLDKTKQTKNALQSLGLEGSVNTGILSGLSQMVQPQAEAEFATRRKNGEKVTTTEIVDRMVAEKINEIAKNTSFTDKGRTAAEAREFANKQALDLQQKKGGLSSDAYTKMNEKIQNEFAEELASIKIDFDKFFGNLQKSFQENAKKVGVDNLVKTFIAESFLIPAETLKAQINTFGELQKVILSYTSAEEDNLALKKELITINAQEKANIETQLRLKQEERQTNEQLGNAAFEFVKNMQNTAITKLGTSLPEDYASRRATAMESFAKNVYNPQTTDEQRLKFAQAEVEAIKSTVKSKEQLTNEQKKYLSYLEQEVIQLDLSQKITRSQQAARQDTILKENQRLAIATKNSFIETTIRESLTARLSINQKLLDQDRQRLDIVRKISDIQYETKTLATPNQDPSIKERLDLERSLATSGPRQMEDYQIQRQSALLTDRLNALNIAFQRGANASDVQKITEAQDYQSLEQALQTVLDKEAQSINDRVIKAGDAFFIKAQEAGKAVGEEIFKILNRVSEEDIQDQINIAKGSTSKEDYFGRLPIVTPAAQVAASRLFGEKLPTDPRTESGLPASPATARNVLLGGTPVQNPKDLINAQTEQTIKQLIFAQEKRALDIKLQLTTAEIANAQKAIDLRKEERDWQQKLRDSAFEFYQTQLSPYQSEKAAAYRNIEEERTRGLQENTDRMQERSLQSRQAGVKTLQSRGASLSEINSFLKGEKTAPEIIKSIEDKNIDKMYGLEKDPFAEQVVEAAKEFKQIILGAGASFVSGKKIASGNIEAGGFNSKDYLGFNPKDESQQAFPSPINGAVSNLRNEELKASVNKAKLQTFQERLSELSPEIERIKNKPVPLDAAPTPEEQATLDYAENLQKSIDELTSALKEKAQQEKDKFTEKNASLLVNAEQPLPFIDRSGQVNQLASNRTRTVNEKFAQEEQFGKGFRSGLRDIDDEITKFQGKLGKQIPTDFRNGLVDAMRVLSDPSSTASLGERLMGVATAFVNKINEALMTKAANQFTTGLFGNGQPGTGLAGALGFASGGEIEGGSGVKDDVPAMLMGGEYVIRKDVVNKYGKSFFEKLNSGKLKGFASGGPVMPYGMQETDLNDLIRNPNKYTAYGENRMAGLSFDQSGKVTGIDNYQGKEEDKQDALLKAQTNFYSQNQQTGQNGFFAPGSYGQGAIIGQKNLLSFATQETVGTQYDKMSSSGSSASIDIAGGSGNLSLFALRDQGNVRNAQYLESKNKALDLYFQDYQTSKDKIRMDFENEKEYKRQMEEWEKAKKEAKKQAQKALITQLATTAIMAGVSYAGSAMSKGVSATKQAAALQGKTATFGEKFKGAFTGGSFGGESRGGLANIFNSSATKDFSTIGAGALGKQGGGLYSWNNKTNSYSMMNMDTYNTQFPLGASYDKLGTPTALTSGTYFDSFYGRNRSVYNGKTVPMAIPMAIPVARRAAGGYVAGNGMGDNVPAMLNGGEFVVSKEAAQKTGYGALQKLNSTGATGGDSGEMTSRIEAKLEELVEKIAGVGTINISVNSDGKGGEKESQSDSKQDQQNKELARRIKEVVLSVLRDEKRLGGMLR
jgi:TP901 family phage tail tape measure protein